MTQAERDAFVAAVRLGLVMVVLLVVLGWLLYQAAPDFRLDRVVALQPAQDARRPSWHVVDGVGRDGFVLDAGQSVRFAVAVPGDDAVLRWRDNVVRSHPDVAVRIVHQDGRRADVGVVPVTHDAWGLQRLPLDVDAGEEIDIEIAILDGRSKPGLAQCVVADVVLESRGRPVNEAAHPVRVRAQRVDLLAPRALSMASSPPTVETARVDVPGPAVLPLDEHEARSFDLEPGLEDARVQIVVHAARISPDVPTRAATVRVSQGETVLGTVPVVLRPPRSDQEWTAEFALRPDEPSRELRVELLGGENVTVGLREAFVTSVESSRRLLFDPERTKNVLLVVVEGLRADRLGAYGYAHGATPVLDDLARRGLRYERVLTPSSWALPNVASLFTGLSPVAHGMGLAEGRVLSSRAVTLARSASWSGVTTACFASGDTVSPSTGLTLGQETAWSGRAGAPELVERAIDWLADASQFHWFLTLVFDDPLYPHEVFAEDLSRVDATLDPVLLERLRPLDGRPGAAEALAHELGPMYDAEVARVDRALGRFLAALDERDLLENTLVVVVGAHGLEFFERGGRSAGQTLHDDVLTVPVLLAGPGVVGMDPPPLVEPDPIELVDVTMLLGQLGRLFPPALRSGRIPPPFGPRIPEGTMHAVLRPFEGVTRADMEASRRGSLLRIHDRATGRTSLFDLSADPEARVDLLAVEDPVAAAHAATLSQGLASAFETYYLDELERALARPVPVGR